MHLLLPFLKPFDMFLVSLLLLSNNYVVSFIFWLSFCAILVMLSDELNKPIPTPTIKENEEMLNYVREQIYLKRQVEKQKQREFQQEIDERDSKIEHEQLLDDFENILDEIEVRKIKKYKLDLQLKAEQIKEAERMEKLKLKQRKLELDNFEQLQKELKQKKANEAQLEQQLETEEIKQFMKTRKENEEQHQLELEKLHGMIVEISQFNK